jgi:hypothetical protein
MFKVISETRRTSYIWYQHLYCYQRVDTSAGGLLVPEGIILPVVGVSAVTLFIIYIYYWNVQFLNNVIFIKTKVLHIYVFIVVAILITM